jgi:hypothetical protein
MFAWVRRIDPEWTPKRFLINLATGAIASVLVDRMWKAVTGHDPAFFVQFLSSMLLIGAVTLGLHIRLMRKFNRVMNGYYGPSFGGGVDIPGRPPED